MRSTCTRRVVAAMVAATSLCLFLTPSANADVFGPQDPKVKTSGQTISITVSGSGYKGGSSGSGGGGTVSVSVPAPCWMMAGSTGKEYFDYVAAGGLAYDEAFKDHASGPLPEYTQHKSDELGHWYFRTCWSSNWPDQSDMAGFSKFVDQFWRTNRPVYVTADQTPPAPPVPPELLREVAINNLTLPNPELDWNPKRIVGQGTLVNMDTWFWLNNAPESLDVRAEALNSWATVTATFGGMDITAPGEDPLSCVGRGTAYTPGAHDTACFLGFSRASSALGSVSTPVTVKTRWTATWQGNGVAPTPIALQTDPEATVPIRVDEVQTLVTGTG